MERVNPLPQGLSASATLPMLSGMVSTWILLLRTRTITEVVLVHRCGLVLWPGLGRGQKNAGCANAVVPFVDVE